jgi:hypothetical protein
MIKPRYCGGRTGAYGPAVASRPCFWAAKRTRQPEAISQNPPMMKA